MKRYIVLALVGVVAFSFLLVLYQKSESQLSKDYQKVMELLLTAKQVEATLEKDLLKSRNFLLLTYDPIVSNEREVEKICVGLKDQQHVLYGKLDTQLDKAIDLYCEALERKMGKIESFKSKNAILRNSIYFLQKLASEGNELKNVLYSGYSKAQAELLRLSLAYALVSSEETKENLEKALRIVKNKSKNDDMHIVESHASKIFELKGPLDNLTHEVVNSESAEFLESIRQIYEASYTKAESSASFFRQILFAASVLFLLFVFYNVTLLWKGARKLADANESLERRVKERTKELQESQETIVQQQQALISSAKMSSLGEMAGGIAHEINTPLAVIGMRVEQLEECVTDGSLQSDDLLNGLNVIKITTARIAKIISGLRFFARDGKSAPTQMTPVNSIVADTLSFCQERFANHGVSIELKNNLDYSTEIDCRSVEISQVLLNLLNNAYDAIESSTSKKWVGIEIHDRDQYVEINVIDSGPGIPKEIQEKIMQPFFTTKEIGKGTGLGLSISKGVIQSHNGKFFLDIEAKNTCFVILLPKNQSDIGQYKESV